ncbi:MAG: MFS transporter [Candidatus Thiodiazotropha sp.]
MNTQDINKAPVLFAAILLTTIGLLVPNILPILVGAIANNLSFDNDQLGLLAGIEPLGLGISAALAVFWIRRVSWRQAALSAIFVLIIGNAISVLLTDFTTLLIVRGLTGFFGGGVAFAIGIAAISESRDTDRSFALMVMVHVASMFLGLLLLPHAEIKWGIAGILIPVSLLATVLIPITRILPECSHKGDPSANGSIPDVGPVFWGLGAQLVWYIGVGGLWTFIERIGTHAGFENTDIGYALALGMGVSIIGSAVATAQGDRIGRLVPFTLTLTTQVVAALFLIDIDNLLFYTLVWMAFNTAWNYGLPYIYAAIADADHSGRFVVMVPTAQAFGFALGASISGFLIESTGLSAVIYLCLAMNAATALLFIILSRANMAKSDTNHLASQPPN